MKLRSLRPVAVVGLATAGLLALGVSATTTAGYVDSEAAAVSAETAPPGAYLPSDSNRAPLMAATLSGGSVYLWGALGGGLTGDGRWLRSADGPSKPDVVRVDLPLTINPQTTAPIRIAQVATNANLLVKDAKDEYTAGTTVAALSESGDVYTWGSNYNGKLGAGLADQSVVCSRGVDESVLAACGGPILSGVTKIMSSSNGFYALTSGGDLYGWGGPVFQYVLTSTTLASGELGAGVTAPVTSPKLLKTGVTDFWTTLNGRFDLVAGAITFSGVAHHFIGKDLSAGTTPALAAPVTDYPMADLTTKLVGKKIVDIQSNMTGGLVLLGDGTIRSWGTSGSFTVGVAPSGSYRTLTPLTGLGGKQFVDIAVGDRHAVAVASDGSLYGWGAQYAFRGTQAIGDVYTATPVSLIPLGVKNIAVSALPFTTFVTKADYSLIGYGGAGGATAPLLPGAKGIFVGAPASQYVAPPTILDLPGIR